MRIAINGYFYSLPCSGQGIYLKNVFERLSLLGDGNEYVLFKPLFSGTFRRWYKIFWEHIEFPLRCFVNRTGLAFVPYFGPPLFSPVPVISTIHDLVPYIFSQYRLPIIGRVYNLIRLWGAKRAHLLVADSYSTRDDILKILHAPDKKIRVVYLGVEGIFKKVTDQVKLEETKRKMGLPDNFILYVGGFDFRKNTKRLHKAFNLLRDQDASLSLVLIGKPKDKNKKYFNVPGVKIIDNIAREQLPYIYNLSKVFVYPSLYEGFGLPPLEAFACGTPVVIAKNSSLVELFGSAAYCIDNERNLESIHSAINHSIHSGTLEYRSKQAKGFEIAGRLTWEETARKLSRIFDEVKKR